MGERCGKRGRKCGKDGGKLTHNLCTVTPARGQQQALQRKTQIILSRENGSISTLPIRVSHNTPFFELSIALLTTHAIGL